MHGAEQLRPLPLPFILIALLALVWPRPAAAAHADAASPGVRTTGAPGIRATIAELMARPAQAPGEPSESEDEVDQPDRSGLPQDPASPLSPAWPLPSGANGTSAQRAPGITASPQAPGMSFTAATLAGVNPTFSFPPDCMGAIGPTQFVVCVNNRLVTFDRTTGLADGVLNATTNAFFAPAVDSTVGGGANTTDPRIRYDRLTGRWFLTIATLSRPNRILIAVSDGAGQGSLSPATVFTFFHVSPAGNCFMDYPTLAIDANALYIGTNDFCPTQYAGGTGYVVRKSSLLGAGPIVVTTFSGLALATSGMFTPHGADNFDPGATEGYFIGVDVATFGRLVFRRVADPGGIPTISAASRLTVLATNLPLKIDHLGNVRGTVGKLDGIDDRLIAAHVRDGHLWASQNVGVDNAGVASGTRTRDGCRWYQLHVPLVSGPPTVEQQGTVFAASAANTTDERNYWMSSIMVTGQGHAGMGFSTAGTQEYVDAGFAGRLASDARGTMQAAVALTNSATAYNANSVRWGDYTYTSLDPLDDMTLWTVQQFCDATNSYGLRVVQMLAPPPATATSAPDVETGRFSAVVTVSGTTIDGSGFFDPGADLPGVPAFHHVSAAVTNTGVTGTPPTVNHVTFVSPTTLLLDLNTAGATPNLAGEKYGVRVTNPDGQVAEGAFVVHVTEQPTAAMVSRFTAEPRDAGIELRWQFGPGLGVRDAALERADAGDDTWAAVSAGSRDDAGVSVATDRSVEPGHAYQYRLVVTNLQGQVSRFGPVLATAAAAPGRFTLDTVRPNPSTGAVQIGFSVGREAPVKVSVVDIQGREVAVLVSGVRAPGHYVTTWDGRSRHAPASTGVYFVRYGTAGFEQTRRMTIAR